MSAWHASHNGLTVSGLGCRQLLTLPMTAFFVSRQCPGLAIRAAMDWALVQAQQKNVVISGFHSPLEQSVLKVLLEAQSPVVAVLARQLDGARFPSEWIEPLAQERMAVVSASTSTERLTGELATERNQLVAQLAEQTVVVYASPGGALHGLCTQWRSQGRKLVYLSKIA
jgi:predicted Rossmann fold nucleotide-binding protein DprA/Smf involved in DNA uptake